MISHLDSKDPDYFKKRIAEKEKNRLKEYQNGEIINHFAGASKRAKIIRRAHQPDPL